MKTQIQHQIQHQIKPGWGWNDTTGSLPRFRRDDAPVNIHALSPVTSESGNLMGYRFKHAGGTGYADKSCVQAVA